MIVTEVCDRLQAHSVPASAATCWGSLCLGWRSGKGHWSLSPFNSVCRKLRKIFSYAWGACCMEVSCYAWDEFCSWNACKIRLVTLSCCTYIWCYYCTQCYVLYSLEPKLLCLIFHCIATLLMSAHNSKSACLCGLERCFWCSILKALTWRWWCRTCLVPWRCFSQLLSKPQQGLFLLLVLSGLKGDILA